MVRSSASSMRLAPEAIERTGSAMLALRGIPAALVGAFFALLVSGLAGYGAVASSRAVPPLLAAIVGTLIGILVAAGILFGPVWIATRSRRRNRSIDGPFAQWFVDVLLHRHGDQRDRRIVVSGLFVGYAAHAGLFWLAGAWHDPYQAISVGLWAILAWLAVNAVLCLVSYRFGR